MPVYIFIMLALNLLFLNLFLAECLNVIAVRYPISNSIIKCNKVQPFLIHICEISDYNKTDNSFTLLQKEKQRYILYDVNPPEGFNLRRDVYVRIATFIKHLTKADRKYKWHLVLPPWGPLHHWQSNDLGLQIKVPWGKFFDLDSLNKYIPVIELYEFLKDYKNVNNHTIIDQVFYLQNDLEMFKSGNFEDKNIITKCPKGGIPYRKLKNEQYAGYFWGYKNITAYNFHCVIFHGTTFDLKKNLKPEIDRSIMFDHIEIPLHNEYGSVEYWKARRSMRYNNELVNIANEFRRLYLNSNDVSDKTERPSDWTTEKKKRNAKGGPYLSVHFRRRDFLMSHSSTSPSIERAASQIIETLQRLKLNTVFVATDANDAEFIQLQNKLNNFKVTRYLPTEKIRSQIKDGGLAIVDQIICSYASYFIGTRESTFTFRIQEDREILGFQASTTFNTFCNLKTKCPKERGWEIMWDS